MKTARANARESGRVSRTHRKPVMPDRSSKGEGGNRWGEKAKRELLERVFQNQGKKFLFYSKYK